MRRVNGRGRRGSATLLDELLRDAGRSLLDGFGDRVSSSMRDLLQGALRRVLLATAGLAALLGSIVFLLVAAAEGLKEAGLPPSAAYLGVGVVGLLAGLLLVRLRR